MSLPLALCSLHREVALLYNTTARDLGLTLQQAELLCELEDGRPSFGELARSLGCDKTNITGMVDRLDRRGLLRRETDPADRRVCRPVLTRDGHELVRSIRAAFTSVVEQRCGTLPSADLQQLIQLSESVTKVLAAGRI